MQLTGVSKALTQLLKTEAWLPARWVMSTECNRASHGRHMGWLSALINPCWLQAIEGHRWDIPGS